MENRNECPLCDENVIECQEEITVEIKGEEVQCVEEFSYCRVCDNKIYNKQQLSRNILAEIDGYRGKNNLLTSGEIKQIRREFKMTQKEFSNILGWGDVTIQRYEKKAIQDRTYNDIMLRFRDDPRYALEQLEKNNEHLEEGRYGEIRGILTGKVKAEKNKILQEYLRASYIDYVTPSIENGFKLLDFEKIDQMIRFFVQNNARLYKTKLLKLLWYADFLNFKKHSKLFLFGIYCL